MKVYTKTGDQGFTSLLTGERVLKTSLRVEAYGTVDEINSVFGIARAICCNSDVKQTVFKLQKLLMLIMADLASIQTENFYIKADSVSTLEAAIDEFDANIAPLKSFIVPGDTPAAAYLDLARTVSRRAERQVLRLMAKEKVNGVVAILLNRLSDLCFVLSRVEAKVKE